MHPIVPQLVRKALHRDAMPEPVLSALLTRVRRELCAELLDREQGEIAGVRALWEADRRQARPVLAALAERLVAEHRARTLERLPRFSPLHRLAGAVDRAMPVDTVELMDRADVAVQVKERIITDLDRLQLLIGSYDRLLDVAAPYLGPGDAGDGPLRILDLASGHGGLPAWLARHARDRGLPWTVIASDINPDFVRLCRQQAAAAGVEVEGRVLDALDMDLEPGSVDLVTCTSAIHHLGHGQVAVLFAEAARVARRGVVFLDGYRSPTQLAVAVSLFVAFGAARPTLHDTVVSVRKMFVPEELTLIAGCTPGAQRALARWVPPGWAALHGPGWGG